MSFDRLFHTISPILVQAFVTCGAPRHSPAYKDVLWSCIQDITAVFSSQRERKRAYLCPSKGQCHCTLSAYVLQTYIDHTRRISAKSMNSIPRTRIQMCACHTYWGEGGGVCSFSNFAGVAWEQSTVYSPYILHLLKNRGIFSIHIGHLSCSVLPKRPRHMICYPRIYLPSVSNIQSTP